MKRTKELKQEFDDKNGLTQEDLSHWEQEYLSSKVECYGCGEFVDPASCEIELIADNTPEDSIQVAICPDCVSKKLKLFNHYEE